MNWLLMVIGGCFLIGLIVGAYRGAVKIAVSLLATVLTFVIVFFATPYVSKAISTMTPLEEVLESQIVTTISKMMTDTAEDQMGVGSGDPDQVRSILSAAGIGEEELNALGITVEDIAEGKITADDLAEMGISRNLLTGLQQESEEGTNVLEGVEIPRETQIAAIEGADIPEIFKKLLLANNNDEIYEKLGVTTFISYVARYLTNLIIHILSFLLTFVLVAIIFRAILFALDFVADLPVIGFFNRLGGAVLGMGGVLIIVWLVFVVITLLYTTTIGKELMALIEEDTILKLIYDHNPILQLATKLRG